MKKFYKRYKLLSLVILMLYACQKEDFTEPVSVNMEVKIAEGSSQFLTFTGGKIMLDQIAFDGHRKQGGDVHFATEGENDIGPVNFSEASAGQVKKFDIPQGVYSHMKWRFELEDIDFSDDADLDHTFLHSQDGGLIIEGTFKNTNGGQVPVFIIVDDEERHVAVTEGDNGYDDITLVSSNSYIAQLLFDPYYAMLPVSIESLESAEVSNDGNNNYIEISADKNETLYESILFRLENSIKVVVK